MTQRNRSQMTLEVFEEEQQSLDGIADETPPTPRLVDDDTIAAVAPRGALDLLRQLEGAA